VRRFRLSRKVSFGLFIGQAIFYIGAASPYANAQTAVGAKPALPTPLSASSLTGLEQPPQIVVAKPAIPQVPTISNISGDTKQSGNGQATDLIGLYQEAAFSDPVMSSARFLYVANQEQYWQGLSVLMPQVNATPALTRYYQHAAENTSLSTFPGNGRVFGQKNYTVSLTQPLLNVAAFEVYKQGDLNTKITNLQFYQAQQDLVLRVSQAYFDVLTSQDNVELYKNKKDLT
jgi:outer membrane protein